VSEKHKISVTTSGTQNPYGLRIPEALKDLLKEKAKQNGRSLNSEMLIRLRESIERDQLICS